MIAIEIGSLLAVIAGMATDIVVDDHFVAGSNVDNIFADLFDRSRKFMAQDDRVRRPGRTVSVDDREIGPADRSVAGLQDHVAGLNPGFFNIREGQIPTSIGQ
jgi:hypothetical protein